MALTGSSAPMGIPDSVFSVNAPLLGRLAAFQFSSSWSGNSGALLRVSAKTGFAAAPHGIVLGGISSSLGIAVSVQWLSAFEGLANDHPRLPCKCQTLRP